MVKYKKIFLTIFITIGAFTVNYGINFFLTPFITDHVGTAAYGYVSLAKTIASYANIVTVALNGYASRFIAVEYHNKRYEQANIYYSSVFISDVMLAAVIFVVFAVFSVNINRFFDVSPEILLDIKILFILIFMNLALNISTTVLQAAVNITNKVDVTAVFKGLSYVAEGAVLALCYVWFVPHVSYVGIGVLTGTIVISGCNAWITRRYTPELKVRAFLFSWPAVKELVAKGIWNSVSSIGSLFNSGMDLVVTNIWLSPLAMGQISIVKSITIIFATVYQQTSLPFQPILLREYAVEDKKGLLKDLIQEIKVVGLVSAIFLMGFASLGQLYFQLWVPNQDGSLLYRITLIAVLAGIIEGAANPLYYVYTLTVKNKLPSMVTILGGLSNLLGMYLLIHYTGMGLYAVQLTTACVAIFIGLIFNPLYATHCLQVRWFTFYPVLIWHIVVTAAMGVIFSIVVYLLQPETWIGLIGCAIVEILIGSCFYAVCMFSAEEKNNVKRAIKEMCNKL